MLHHEEFMNPGGYALVAGIIVGIWGACVAFYYKVAAKLRRK